MQVPMFVYPSHFHKIPDGYAKEDSPTGKTPCRDVPTNNYNYGENFQVMDSLDSNRQNKIFTRFHPQRGTSIFYTTFFKYKVTRSQTVNNFFQIFFYFFRSSSTSMLQGH